MDPHAEENSVSDAASSVQTSVVNNRLFPAVIHTKDKADISNVAYVEEDLSESRIDEDSGSSSIGKLRHMFHRKSFANESYSNEYDLSEGGIPRDTHSESVADYTDEYSLHSSIIKEMVTSPTGPNHETSERFKFLRTYEMLEKAKEKENQVKETVQNMKDKNAIPLQLLRTDSHGSSIFHLSKLDDFNRYVKQTELNERIYAKLKRLAPNQEAGNSVLEVVETPELAHRFYAGNHFEDERRTRNGKGKQWFNMEWKRHNSPSKSEISELNYDNASPSSSSSEQKPQYLQRKLKIRHLQMISFGGTLGVGLFLNSGKALTIAGGLGTLLAFVICGVIVLATIVSFCEMVTFVSVVDGVSGLSSRFVDDAFGFCVGWLYFISFAFGLAGEVVASVIILAYYPQLDIPENRGSTAGFVTLFLALVLLSNMIDVRVFGEIEYISSFIKLVCVLIMIVVMIAMNRGAFGSEVIGFKYWQSSQSVTDHNLIFGLFRPTFNLHDDGTSSTHAGIGGDKGRFLSLLVALMIVSYAYSGTEIVCIAACEAQNPRKALPSATKRVFWRILIFYCLSAFVVSLNVYAGDPRLLRYYSGNTGVASNEFSTNYAIKYAGGVNCNSESIVFAGFGSGAQSPWIVAIQSAAMCKFSSVVNGFLVFFAVSCGNAQLYVSSRTVYSLALQRKAPKALTYCNRYGIPYNAVLFAASFGLLSFICVSESATVVFQNLTSIIASSGIIVWFAMCLSYIRFYYGLRRRPDIISRDDKNFPYKSPFQPYSAILGLIGSGFIILGMGFVVFLKGEWDTMFFFSSYGTVIVFAVLYVGYRVIKGTRIPALDTLDFDSGRTEMDRIIWDGGREYNMRNIKDVAHKWASFLA
ncbi:amino acid permease-domain-containing protein [Scheffersomyces xylosifermentans]|uniref:amino acid permease-domain-containing protein n=1 Tax=Scheffersomyces xylosifermentans TaxID=1304137 RepID=UPI00315D0A6E